MQERLQQMKETALQELGKAASLTELQDLKVRYLGKKGVLTDILRGMGQLSAEERPVIGGIANVVRESLESLLVEKTTYLEKAQIQQRLQSETIDVTLPGRPIKTGANHPLTRVIEEIEDVFIGMGFEIAEGPELETDYYNFEGLGIPKDHPARDMQDTFFITEDLMLRTHTSSVQARTLEARKGQPVKILCPGRVYRRDEDDATHSHQFMQIEALVVGEGIRMSDLKGTLETFVKRMFGDNQKIRLRPSYFQFTEPSAEVDVSCMMCGGDGCRVCKHTGWIEILGSGMVHPHVLELAGYDTEKYTGFAFGLGVERIAMLKYGVDDIRHFYTNDLRLLQQFSRAL